MWHPLNCTNEKYKKNIVWIIINLLPTNPPDDIVTELVLPWHFIHPKISRSGDTPKASNSCATAASISASMGKEKVGYL